MAARPISSKNLAAAMAGMNLEAQSFSVTESQPTEDTSCAGDKVYSRNQGSGTPTMVVGVQGWAQQGAASTNPGFGVMAGAAGDTGIACTFTIDTGNTIAGNFVPRQLSLGVSRIRAGAPVGAEFINGDTDPTVTWPVS